MSSASKTASKLAGVLGVAVADEEPRRFHPCTEVVGQVAGLLDDPLAGGMRGDTGDVEAAGAVFEEHQGVETPQSDGVDVQEVAGDDAVCLSGKEFSPGRTVAARCGVDAGCAQNVPDGGCGDGVAEPGEFAVDPAVSPSAVLGGKPHDELADRGRCRWSARCRAPGRVVPFPSDKFAVPGQQCRRCDGKDRCPPVARDESGEGAEPEPVRWLVLRALSELAAEDRVLVSQDQELGVPGGLAAEQRSGDREQVAGHVVGQRDDHAGIVSTSWRAG